jgi:hypothetical protein
MSEIVKVSDLSEAELRLLIAKILDHLDLEIVRQRAPRKPRLRLVKQERP